MSEAPPGTPLAEPGGVAVDHASGDVFVADPGSGFVDVFSSSGSFVTQFGEGVEATAVAVDEGSGDVYVAQSSAVDVFKPNGSGVYELLSEWEGAGTPGKAFGEVAGVAVDNSTSASDPSKGDVYVVDSGSGAVDVFRPGPAGPEEAREGEFLHVLTGAKLEEPNGVAVSAASGRVYVAESAKGLVDVFEATGAFESRMKGASSPQGTFSGKEGEEGNVSALAVDETTGDLLVAEAERHVVSEFNGAGEWVGWVTGTPSGAFGEPRDVAVGSSGDVYVADTGRRVVDVFGAGVVVPDAKTIAASKVTRTTAVLNGAIDGDGKPAHYRFEWGTSEALGSSTPVMSNGGGEEKALATLTELHAGTTYFFRLSGENENGANSGVVREFTTPPAVEALSTGPVANVTPTGAMLTGSLTPGEVEAATYYFEWGLTGKYGSESPEPPGKAPADTKPFTAETELKGLLSPNTTYHYRLVGTNKFGTTFGEDEKFTTSGPPRITSEPTTGIGHETATINAKVNPDEFATKYHFEYGESTSYGTVTPPGGGSIPSGEAPVPISAALTKLELGVTYHYRVVADNEAGTTFGPDETFTTIPPALIDSESAAEVNATAATLQTEINPLGHDTTYYFQYGTESCDTNPAGCTSLPSPPGTDVGSGEADQPGSVRAQELTPGTTYHYRVLALNSLGTAEGVERTFTTQPSETPFALPDDRAWELVTPPDKHGAPVEALTREGGLIMASEDGNRLAYVADGTITEEAQGDRSPEMQQVLATRGAEGWSSQDIVTPNSRAQGVSPGQAPEYQFFTPDLSFALVEPWGDTAFSEPPLAPEAAQKTIYVRDNGTGTYLPLVTEGNVSPPGTVFGHQIHFLGATADLGHVVFRSAVALTGAGSGPGLYEWAGGKLQFVSVLPGGAVAREPELGYYHVDANAISTDGSRIIWTTSELNHRGHLYMRDTAAGKTIQLDAAQGPPEPGGPGVAQFQAASSDGSRVFFTDEQRLTGDSTAEPAQGKADLYECEMVEEEEGKLACHLKDLTVDQNAGESAAVQGFVFGASTDGASVYLVAQGVLAGDENGNGEKALATKENLYELHYDGVEWTRTFIAVLSGEDKVEWEGNSVADSAFLTARVSPNGRYLAFMTAASPTGYDNSDQNSAKHDEEVYLYDSRSPSLRCVSCNPTGARPVGVLDAEESGEGLGLLVDRREVWVGHWLAGNIPGWTAQSLTSALYQSRYLSDSGRLFFDSPDDLVPQASNGKENVYEYEPSGLGSCQSASGGCVALISSGSSGRESAFLEATPNGDDVFFLTAASLLPQDTDTAFDIYDARVCTQVSPCLTAPSPAPPGCATTNGCRPASPSQPAPVGPSGTATVSGQGNVVLPTRARQEYKAVKVASKPLTRAQKLSKALQACKTQRFKHKRRACVRHARKQYGPMTKTAKARKSSSGRSTGRRR